MQGIVEESPGRTHVVYSSRTSGCEVLHAVVEIGKLTEKITPVVLHIVLYNEFSCIRVMPKSEDYLAFSGSAENLLIGTISGHILYH